MTPTCPLKIFGPVGIELAVPQTLQWDLKGQRQGNRGLWRPLGEIGGSTEMLSRRWAVGLRLLSHQFQGMGDFLKNVYLFILRERERSGERQREREKENPKKAPHY